MTTWTASWKDLCAEVWRSWSCTTGEARSIALLEQTQNSTEKEQGIGKLETNRLLRTIMIMMKISKITSMPWSIKWIKRFVTGKHCVSNDLIVNLDGRLTWGNFLIRDSSGIASSSCARCQLASLAIFFAVYCPLLRSVSSSTWLEQSWKRSLWRIA